jgi:predicted small metal-binding protein
VAGNFLRNLGSFPKPLQIRYIRSWQPSSQGDDEVPDFSCVEDTMGRKFIDCRAFPSEMNCSIAISADSEDELLEAAVQHAVAVHRHQDSPALRDQLKGIIKNGMPSEAAPGRAA